MAACASDLDAVPVGRVGVSVIAGETEKLMVLVACGTGVETADAEGEGVCETEPDGDHDCEGTGDIEPGELEREALGVLEKPVVAVSDCDCEIKSWLVGVNVAVAVSDCERVNLPIDAEADDEGEGEVLGVRVSVPGCVPVTEGGVAVDARVSVTDKVDDSVFASGERDGEGVEDADATGVSPRRRNESETSSAEEKLLASSCLLLRFHPHPTPAFRIFLS